MPLYLISYDLLHKRILGDHDIRVEELPRLECGGGAGRAVVFAGRNEAAEARNHLAKMVHPEDRLLVTDG